MPQTKECEVCGKEFEARRSTARFCTAACRVANHRYNPQAQIEYHLDAIFQHIRDINRIYEKDDKVTLQAIDALAAVQQLVTYHVPGHGTWWHNRTTGQNVQTPLLDMMYRSNDDEWIITDWKGQLR